MTQIYASTRMRLPRGSDRYAVALIREMEDDGWTGALSRNCHVIMRAPDNGPTCSISLKTGSPSRSRGNLAMVYRRWKREQS